MATNLHSVRLDKGKCVGCKSCMKIGCPALSVRDKKAHIDATQCIGCGICTQMCRFGALTEQGG